MKLYILLLLITFLSSSLSAEYLRSIRVGSFLNESDANGALSELEEFVQSREDLVRLKRENLFELKARKSGKYYITLIEPLRSRAVLQKLLDRLREVYPDVYVTKLSATQIEKSLNKREKVEAVDKSDVLIEQAIREFNALQKRRVEIEERSQKTLEASKSLEPPKSVEAPKSLEAPKAMIEEAQEQSFNLWKLYFAIALFVALLALFRLLVVMKRVEVFRTKEMSNEVKLEQCNAEIVKKSKIVSHVSHELRTPMTAILGLSHLLLNEELHAGQRETIDRIKTSSEQLLAILNDILDASKIESGGLRLEKSEFNINTILNYSLHTLSLSAKSKGITLRCSVEEDVPSHIIGDSLRLGQILINLLGNAVKFTPKDGRVELIVKVLSKDVNSIKLEFRVLDTGVGMSQEELQSLFKAFSQADESTSREYGGTGLGLVISKELIEIMDGSIRVESEKAKGSSFIFNLQFSIKDADNRRQYRLPNKELMRKSVLLVEPNATTANSLKRMLMYFKYSVYLVPSFEEAIINDDMKFNIVIVEKKTLSEYTLEKVETLREKNSSKVVLLSHLYEDDKAHFTHELNADVQLFAPFNQQDILNMIVKLFSVPVKKRNIQRNKIKKELNKYSNKHIIVAEDNEINQRVIAGLLKDTGMRVSIVGDGERLLELLESDIEPDLILMDINMPIINGYEATEQIRSSSSYKNVPILALSADLMDEAIEKAIEVGMQGYIEKPIVIDSFYNKIKAIFEETKQQKIEKKVIASKEEEEYMGLSTQIGLSRCNNDIKFYISLLKEFLKIYTKSSSVLNRLCAEGDFRKARRFAMDIKDVSLNIGAYKLSESIAALEYELEKAPRVEFTYLIREYEESLEELIEDINKYIEKEIAVSKN